MIEIENVELVVFEDTVVEDIEVSRRAFAGWTPEMIGTIPVKLQMGAVKFRVGEINRVRIGANGMTGDIFLQIKGELILTMDGKNPKPLEYLFKFENGK